MARRLVLFACLSYLALPAAPAAAATKQEIDARKAYAAGRYEQALELFAQLYAETLHPTYLRNIGRCHQKLRESRKGIDALREYLSKGKDIKTAERREIEGYIHEMEAALAAETPAPAAASRAEPTPAATAPRAATPAATMAPAAPPSAPPPQVDASRSPAEPVAPEPAVYQRWWFWTAAGVVVMGAVGAVLLLGGGRANPTCPSGVVCH